MTVIIMAGRWPARGLAREPGGIQPGRTQARLAKSRGGAVSNAILTVTLIPQSIPQEWS